MTDPFMRTTPPPLPRTQPAAPPPAAFSVGLVAIVAAVAVFAMLGTLGVAAFLLWGGPRKSVVTTTTAETTENAAAATPDSASAPGPAPTTTDTGKGAPKTPRENDPFSTPHPILPPAETAPKQKPEPSLFDSFVDALDWRSAMTTLDGVITPIVIGNMSPENLARLNVTIACPKPEPDKSVLLQVTKDDGQPETWNIHTSDGHQPSLATISLEEGKLRLTPKPLAAKTPALQRLLSRSVLLFATDDTRYTKGVFLCMPTSSPKRGSNPTACSLSGSTTINLGDDKYVAPPLRIDDAARMHCRLQWSSGGKPSDFRVTFRQGKNKVPATPPAEFVSPVEIDGKPGVYNYPIPLLPLELGESSVALKAEADFKNGIIRIVPIITGKEVPSWLTLENLAGQKCDKVIETELDKLKEDLATYQDYHRNDRRTIPNMRDLFKSLEFEKDNEDKANALCQEYTDKHHEVNVKTIPIKEWEDFAKEQEPAFDEIKELALAKVRHLHDAFATLQDVQFQIDRIESDAWLENKAYPVPLFIAADAPPPTATPSRVPTTPPVAASPAGDN